VSKIVKLWRPVYSKAKVIYHQVVAQHLVSLVSRKLRLAVQGFLEGLLFGFTRPIHFFGLLANTYSLTRRDSSDFEAPSPMISKIQPSPMPPLVSRRSNCSDLFASLRNYQKYSFPNSVLYIQWPNRPMKGPWRRSSQR
jgi:hypothetical protein